MDTALYNRRFIRESAFTSRHIDEFAGIPAIYKQVDVPLSVLYDLNKNGLIQKARIYMLTDVMMQQLKSKSCIHQTN